MTENIQFAVAAFCGLTVFGVCYYYFLLKNNSVKQSFINKAKSNGWVAEGVCVAQKTRYGTHDINDASYLSNDTLIVKYEYMVKGVKYYKKLKFQSPGMVSIKFPYKVKVYYNPKNPKKSFCQEEISDTGGCLITIIATVGTLIVIFNLLKRIGR